MFHVFTLQGVQHNVPLESLHKTVKVNKTAGNTPARKVITGQESNEQYKQRDRYSRAEKAYSDALKLKHDREELLYAYMIMSSPVITITRDIPVSEAWEYFRKSNVNHMPVVTDKKEIIGIVSDRDLLKHLIIEGDSIENTTSRTINDIMTTNVITASCVTDIRRIAKVLFEQHIGTMPVLDDANKLAGIITRSDILYALIHYPALKLWA